MEYDIIIIGSGISGLYAAYIIRNQRPDLSFLVLEKHKKQWIGGRASNETFYGTELATGAGIGRKQDKLLKHLQRELGFEIKEFKSVPEYSKLEEPIDILKVMAFLRGKYQKYRGPSTTFEKFAKPLLGQEVYDRFLYSAGYRDFEKEDVHDTLYNYGMEDNACCLTGFGVHWRKTILALAAKIGESNIKFSQNVVGISGEDGRFLVHMENGRDYCCKKIIVATTITSLRKFFPERPIYREIEGQPFLRIYGKFAKQSIPIMKEYMKRYICVPGPIQKMIAMNPDEGVYMIVYNDNKNALKLKDRTENTKENCVFYCGMIERALGIPRGRLDLIGIRSYYWAVGTHFYKPLSVESGQSGSCKPLSVESGQSGSRVPLDQENYKTREEFIDEAQHPEDGILVVGEVVSKHQGWVEGALESVKAALTKKWVENI